MTNYKLYINAKEGGLTAASRGKDVSTIEAGSICELMQAFSRRVARDEIPEFANCELWEQPRGKWRLMDGWTYRKEMWT